MIALFTRILDSFMFYLLLIHSSLVFTSIFHCHCVLFEYPSETLNFSSHKPLFLDSYYETPCIQEILRNGFDKLDGVGVTHLDLAAHGTVIIII